ncbi:MAG TPA: flagellar hook-basal body complex protein [Xanthobacteraceae bacterium]
MGIFDALTTAVSGLSAQSFALQNISGNIANSQTTAYKGIQTSFQDLVSDNLPSQQIAGSVLANSVPTNNVQGDIQNASTSTNMAINGNGYFIVEKPTTFTDNQPVFAGVNLYTRRGDFQLDQNGFLVNGAGYYLMGIPVDPTTGNPTGSIPTTLQFSNNLIPAQETSQIQYNANLPSVPQTPATQSGVSGSNLLNPANFTASPLAGAPSPATVAGTGATLQPDAPATGAGTVNALGTGTNLTTLGVTAGDVITITNGTNPQSLTVTNLSTVQDIMNLGGASNPDFKVTLQAGALQIQSTNDVDQLTISDTTNNLNVVGFAAGNQTFTPVNLITQNAAGLNQTMTVTVGSNPVQTITFGTAAGDVQTMAQLNAKLQALAGVNPTSTGIDSNGNITITAANTSDAIQVGGTFSPTEFGIANTLALPANGSVFGVDEPTFLNESIAGGSITSFTGTGAPANVQFRWAKVDSSTLGPGHADTWNMFYQTNSSATNTQAAWVNVGKNFTFNSNGQLSPPISSLTLNNVNVDGLALGNVQVAFGSGGLTQFANTNGSVQVNLLTQNGASAGQLQSIAVDGQGRVVGTYSNGRTVPLAEVTLANFNGQNNLKQLDGGAYQATADSGPALLNATGSIVGSSLEASNVDIADEFSKLIVTQQAYSANTRIITTANQMVQDLLNVVR